MDLRERAQEREIDGTLYRCWPLPFSAMRPLLVRLFNKVAPGLSAALAGVADAGDEGAQRVRLMGALTGALGALSDDDVAALARALGSASEYVDGDRNVPLIERNHDMHFAGRPDVYLAWIQFGLEVNGAARFFSTMTGIGATAP